MLRDFFPSTNKGASLYGGFLKHENCFSRIFDLKDGLTETIKEINAFLETNGYTKVNLDEWDETNAYRNEPVTIESDHHNEQLLLSINRDVTSKSQSYFLINELKKFRDERDWNQFHNPKDLALAISIEAGELLEQFLWKKAEEAKVEKVKEELADIFAFALLLSDKYNFDIEEIILDKIERNGIKYPVDKAKGTAKKYDEL
jgi:NTP pyrophosphatase (non-canonical NTP hydrolase)